MAVPGTGRWNQVIQPVLGFQASGVWQEGGSLRISATGSPRGGGAQSGGRQLGWRWGEEGAQGGWDFCVTLEDKVALLGCLGWCLRLRG